MTTGEKIRKLRLKKGLTQKKLGELSGINESQIRRYELGLNNSNPKIETLKKIARALEVDISEISDFAEYKQSVINQSPALSIMQKQWSEDNEMMQELLHRSIIESLDITEDKQELLYNYNKLNDNGKEEALKRVSELTEIPKYQQNIVELMTDTHLVKKQFPIENHVTFEMSTDDDKKEED